MKNNEKLLDMIGEIDEQLIPEPAKKKPSKAKWFAVGGGVCAAALVGAIALHGIGRPEIPVAAGEATAEVTSAIHESAEPPEQTASVSTTTTTAPPDEQPVITEETLPVLSDEEYAKILENHRIYPEYELPQQTDDGLVHISAKFEMGAMGFGGICIWVFDISELDTANPWSADLQLEQLPVFRNLSYTEHTGGAPVYLSEDTMMTMAENVAASLGQTVNNISSETIGDGMGNPPEEYADKVYYVCADCDEVTIDVYGNGNVKVVYKESVQLPEGYSFSYDNTSDEQGEKTIAYIAQRLRGLLQYDKPVSYSNNDRDIYQQQHRSYYVYDSSDDIVQDILNYNLKFADIAPRGDGERWLIWMHDALACSEYLGDYPVITEEEARAILLEGGGIPGVSGIEESDIAKVELIYRMGDEYIQPYYRYFIDTTDSSLLDAERMGDMKEYSLFHVPAVSAEYLSDFTLWDGIIN
ncbi:MAG: hypothetical protein E7478_03795 [Ruminococcaceae bacterium]|nr:hypothetical protein [Oscillospiraceae bacterium]